MNRQLSPNNVMRDCSNERDRTIQPVSDDLNKKVEG